MKLVFHGTSSHWEEGIPLGNGRMGAVLCSEPETDVLYLNDDTLWSGYPHEETAALTPKIVTAARQAVFRDDYAAATRIIGETTLQERDEQMFEPFGTARIHYSAPSGKRNGIIRRLDLARAIASETFRISQAAVSVESWCSKPDDTLIYSMTSSEAINVSIDVSGKFLRQSKTSLQSGSDARKATLIVMGRMPGLNIGLLPHPSDNPWEDELNGTGMAYAGALSVTVEDGDIQASGNVLHCSNVTGLLLRFRSMSGFRGSNEQPERDMTVIANHLEKSLTEWQSDSQTLLDRHIADYRQYFDRVSVHLGPAHEDDVEVPFTEILRSRTGNAPHRLEKLSEAMFDFGRYLLISSSRPHTQPANLQGLWNHKDFPNWYGAYTTNINVEMNYWMTGPCASRCLD